jgi:CHASE2 domain-containing sensor protein
MTNLSTRVRNVLEGLAALLARHWRNRFYVYLAAAFTLFVVLDAAVSHFSARMRQSTFDAMVRYRVEVPRPDPDIIIVDINEASLAAMSHDYGRWPWPRQVLGEFLENLERQRPTAVVFDILFSDPDVYNPDSDAYFDAAVAATQNTYFPLLRLDSASDSLSRIKPGMIPGVKPIPDETQQDATVAVVLPYFPSVLRGGRVGFHNIYPDSDGIVREYQTYRDDYGWELPSLPLRIARGLGWEEPIEDQVLLNWRGGPFSYRYVTFSDVFNDMANKVKKRPQHEFSGKIVLIGSTAPGLFDTKPTPVSRTHPGVEILATAIDNLKHEDYLRFPEGRVLYPLLTLAILWATAWSFYRNIGRDKIDRLFGASQFILVGVSYASINLSDTYINLTGPVAVGIGFFTVARVYAAATDKALERSVVRDTLTQRGNQQAGLLLIHIAGLGDKRLEKVRHILERRGIEPKSVELLMGRQRGIWGLLENTLAISWALPLEQGAARIARDAEAMTIALTELMQRYPSATATWHLHQGTIAGGELASDEWRGLLADALRGYHEQEAKRGKGVV